MKFHPEFYPVENFKEEFGVEPGQWLDLRQFITGQHQVDCLKSEDLSILREEFGYTDTKFFSISVRWFVLKTRRGYKLRAEALKVTFYRDAVHYQENFDQHKKKIEDGVFN